MLLSTAKAFRTIDSRHPLHRHLATDVLPKAGIELDQPMFEISTPDDCRSICLFREAKSRNHFVGKYFGFRHQLTVRERKNVLYDEFRNLSMIRARGFCGYPHQVVRPFSRNETLDCLLVEDYVRGHDLDHYIVRAAYASQHERLLQKLTGLADFLFLLHQQTASGHPVCFEKETFYFKTILEGFQLEQAISGEQFRAFLERFGEWENSEQMKTETSVLVHGDATPTNFFFHAEDGVTAIDLERMHLADRAYDIGFLAAELKHHFAWRLLNSALSERFISHFIQAYCSNFETPRQAFDSITARNPFYMALGELRIARNTYLPLDHRRWLLEEALRCLTRK